MKKTDLKINEKTIVAVFGLIILFIVLIAVGLKIMSTSPASDFEADESAKAEAYEEIGDLIRDNNKR